MAARARPRLRTVSRTSSGSNPLVSCSALIPAQVSGTPRLINGGKAPRHWAMTARPPCSVQAGDSPPATPSDQRRLRRRSQRSPTRSISTMQSVIRASPTAPVAFPSICQACRMPAERLGMPNSCTAPSSLATSIPISAMPAPIAGRAMGRAIRLKLLQGPTPRDRQASS